jgi:hypothetical protein
MFAANQFFRVATVWVLFFSISAGSVCNGSGKSLSCTKDGGTPNLPLACECPPESECCGTGCCSTPEPTEQPTGTPSGIEREGQRETALPPVHRLTSAVENGRGFTDGMFVHATSFAVTLQAKHIRIQV